MFFNFKIKLNKGKYLGNLRNSYYQEMSFAIKFNMDNALLKSSRSHKDVIIEGANGRQIYRTIYESNGFSDKDTDKLGRLEKSFKFKLSEHDGWRPQLSAKEFQKLLTNVTAIKIKTTIGQYAFLKRFKLRTAQPIEKAGVDAQPALWVEQCTCPKSHVGQFCESCQTNFRREMPFGDSFTRCVPCSCNNHSLSCEPDSGKCTCIYNTVGENCESCKEGYYGDALAGTSTECVKCPCPEGGPCTEIYNFRSKSTEVVCLACQNGTTGNLCEACDDGYYRVSRKGEPLKCQSCDCNGNVDANAVGNCVSNDDTSDTSDENLGKCLRCVFNTTGDKCERCLPGYWGDALTSTKCHACECNIYGSVSAECNLQNGECTCKPNVQGRQCDKCREGFWNLTSGEGCSACKCNPLGSSSLSCDIYSGKCKCLPGVTGDKCDKCMVNHYGFSSEGCKPCECDPYGSLSWQCDSFGACLCKENIGGQKCNKCKENFFNFTLGCTKCDDCYNLVDAKVVKLRERMETLDISSYSQSGAEDREKAKELEATLNGLRARVRELHDRIYSNNNLSATYQDTVNNIEEVLVKNVTVELKKIQKQMDPFDRSYADLNALYLKVQKELDSADLQLTSLSAVVEEQYKTLAGIKDDHVNSTDPSMIKLTELAKKGRQAADEQNKTANDISKQLNKHITALKTMIPDFNEMQLKSSMLKLTDHAALHDEMDKSLKNLEREVNEAKVVLESAKSKMSNDLNELSKLNFKEDDYSQALKTSEEKNKELADFVRRIKIKSSSFSK